MALADILEKLSQGTQAAGPQLERGLANPLTHAGLGIMLGSQQGNPLAGFAQGMQNYGGFAQQAMQARRFQKQEEEEEEAKRLRQMQIDYMKSNPQILEKLRQTNPLAAAQIEMTGDIASIKGLQHFGDDPYKQAQMSKWEAEGRRADRQADIADRRLQIDEQRLKQDYDQFMRQQGLREDQFGFEAYKQQRTEQEKWAEKERTARTAHVDLNTNLSKLDDVTGNINRLISNDSFDKLYTLGGQAPDTLRKLPGVGDFFGDVADSVMAATGSQVPDLRAVRNQIVDQMVFRTIQDLKSASESGATGLGPIAIPEFQALERAGTRLKDAKSPEAAREAMADLVKQINTMRKNMIDRASVNVPAGMQQPPVPTPPAAPQAPAGTNKVISSRELEALARKRGMSVDQIRKLATDRGWVVQ